MNTLKNILISGLFLLLVSVQVNAFVMSSQPRSSGEYLAGDINYPPTVNTQKSYSENETPPSKNCVGDFFSGHVIFRLANRFYLPETQQDRSRLNPKTVSGRSYFISADPLGIDGGVNVYAYANLNPLAFVDPYGLCGNEPYTGPAWNRMSPSAYDGAMLSADNSQSALAQSNMLIPGHFQGTSFGQQMFDSQNAMILSAFAEPAIQAGLGRIGSVLRGVRAANNPIDPS